MNKRLKQLYDEDQEDREKYSLPTPEEFKQVINRDTIRRKEAQTIIDNKLLTTADDYFHIAIIFQHGRTADDYLMANQFAKKAIELGHKKGKWIYAATLDRYLFTLGKPQKFGTQYYDHNGEQLLAPVDPNTTDAERAEYGVRPIGSIPKKWIPKQT